MDPSASTSNDSGAASSRISHDSKIRMYGAKFIMQICITAALMESADVNSHLPLPEEARERMEALLNDEEKSRCRNESGIWCSAYDLDDDLFELNVMLNENGNYVLAAPWGTITRSSWLNPGIVVSLWGYRELENTGFPSFLFKIDGNAEENEPLPSYEPLPSFEPDSDDSDDARLAIEASVSPR